jgi:hypothetical protein
MTPTASTQCGFFSSFFFFRAKTDSFQRLPLLVFNLITEKSIDLYPVSSAEREQESVNMKVRCYLKTCEQKFFGSNFLTDFYE